MAEQQTPTTDRTDPAESSLAESAPSPATSDLIQEDPLVEDVSIDGMCGVY
jgi:mycofactocin precursor